MNYKKIAIIGGGVLGSQIAFQSAYCGYDVYVYFRSDESKKRGQEKIDNIKKIYNEAIIDMEIALERCKDTTLLSVFSMVEWCRGIASINDFNAEECKRKVNDAYNNIILTTNLEDTIKDADLLIESISEIKDEKIKLFKKIAPLIDEKTVMVTNSSTILPSEFSKYTGRPNKFLALHFSNSIWKNNVSEIMVSKDTDLKYFDEVLEFSKSIRMNALPVNKEKCGYLLNSMLIPFILSALDLLASGISDVESIDRAWTLGTGAPKGPFKIIDICGLETAYNIVVQYQKVPSMFGPILKKMMFPYNFKAILDMLKKYLDEGKGGSDFGEGFYKYDEE